MAITLTISGEPKTFPDTLTVRALLVELNLANQAVAVEVNRQLVPKRAHADTTLTDGDTIELVTLVGGG